METSVQKISQLVSERLPDFVKSDYPTFVSFLRAYYEFLETEGYVSERLGNLLKYQDIDQTIDAFKEHLFNKFMNNIPRDIVADKALVLKHIREFYRSKGSKPSYQFLMRILFDKDSEIYLPKTDLFKPSESNWQHRQYLMCELLRGDPSGIDGLQFLEDFSTTDTSGYIEEIFKQSYSNNRKDVYKVYVKNLEGTLEASTRISITKEDETTVIFIVRRTLTGLTITDQGNGVEINDPVIFTTNGVCIGAEARVTDVSSGSVEDITIVDGGIGYRVGEVLIFEDDSGGLGAQAFISSVSSSGSITAIKIVSGGKQYKKIPTVTVEGNSWGSGASLTAVSESIGQVKTIKIINSGVNPSGSLVATLAGASLTSTRGQVVDEYSYLTYDGHPDNNKFIQDSYYWQDFSYEVIISETLDSYKDVVKRLLHPAGTKMFGSYLNVDEVDASGGNPISTTEVGVSLETVYVNLIDDSALTVESYLDVISTIISGIESISNLGSTFETFEKMKFKFRPNELWNTIQLSPNSSMHYNQGDTTINHIASPTEGADSTRSSTLDEIINEPWTQIAINPDSDPKIEKKFTYILKKNNTFLVRSGILSSQGFWNSSSSSSTNIQDYIVLDENASSIDDFYNGYSIFFFDEEDGELIDSAEIISYDGITKVLFLSDQIDSSVQNGIYYEIRQNYVEVNDTYVQRTGNGNYEETNSTNFGESGILKLNNMTYERQKLLASDIAFAVNFGYSVDVHEDYAIVGAPYDDTFTSSSSSSLNGGSAYVFKKVSGVWTQQTKLYSSDREFYDLFGYSVAIHGDLLVVGAPGENSYAGAAYVFKKDDGAETWTQIEKIAANDLAANDYFGTSVDIDKFYVVVGAPKEDTFLINSSSSTSGSVTDCGSVYVFRRINSRVATDYLQVEKIMNESGLSNDNFGHSISLFNKYLVIGAPNRATGGKVYVYERTNNRPTVDISDPIIPSSSSSASSDYVQAEAKAFVDDSGVITDIVITNRGSGYGSTPTVTISAPDLTTGVQATGTSVLSNDEVDSITITNAGSGYKNPKWILKATLSRTDTDASEEFGKSVSIHENRIVVGCPSDDTNGSVYVFDRSGDDWNETQRITNPNASNDLFGASVDVFEDSIVVGAPYYNGSANSSSSSSLDSGAAWLFKLQESVWTQINRYENNIHSTSNNFGFSVCVWDEDVFVGCPNDDVSYTDSGSVTVFEPFEDVESKVLLNFDTKPILTEVGETPDVWEQHEKFVASDKNTNDKFGTSVDVSGQWVIIGSPSDDYSQISNGGSAYLYYMEDRDDPSNWTFMQKLTPSESGTNFQFGTSVSIHGDIAVVGSPFARNYIRSLYDLELTDTGSVFIFKKVGNEWEEIQKLYPLNGQSLDKYGYAVSLHENTLIVGSPGHGLTVGNTGSAYIYNFNSSTNKFDLVQEINTTNTTNGEQFGYSVSVHEDYAIVGAPRYEPESRISSWNSGCAYVYHKDGTVWTEQEKLTAFDELSGSQFGYSVAIYGDYCIVGSPYSDNTATDYSSSSSSSSLSDNYGSAYIFERDGTDWNFLQKLVAPGTEFGGMFGYSVAMSYRHTAIGAYGIDKDWTSSSSSITSTNTGAVFVFVRDAQPSEFTHHQTLYAEDFQENSNFGGSVALNQHSLIIGAPMDDYLVGSITNSGSAYYFKLPALVDDVILRLYTQSKDIMEDGTISVYRVNSSSEWTEDTVTWSNSDEIQTDKLLSSLSSFSDENNTGVTTGVNSFTFDSNINLQYLFAEALGDSINYGLVINTTGLNNRETGFYSSDQKYSQFYPELIIQLSVYPSEND